VEDKFLYAVLRPSLEPKNLSAILQVFETKTPIPETILSRDRFQRIEVLPTISESQVREVWKEENTVWFYASESFKTNPDGSLAKRDETERLVLAVELKDGKLRIRKGTQPLNLLVVDMWDKPNPVKSNFTQDIRVLRLDK